MSIKRKRAVEGTAQNNELHKTHYCISDTVSRERLCIGEFLLLLQAPRKKEQLQALWKVFEVLLREYLAMRSCEVGL